MTLTTTYIFVEIYALDLDKKNVIHTRSVQRKFSRVSGILTHTNTQFLKSNLKQYDVLSLPSALQEVLQKEAVVSYQAIINQKQFDHFMLRDTDLFEVSTEELQFERVVEYK